MCLPKQHKSVQTVAADCIYRTASNNEVGTVTVKKNNGDAVHNALNVDANVDITDSSGANKKKKNTATDASEMDIDDDPSIFITDVTSDDVVLGRGAGPNEHAGNISFRQVVAQFKPSYVATVNRKAKSQIALKVVQAVKAKRGRFLRRAKISRKSNSSTSAVDPSEEPDIFVEAEHDVILEKAKQALRYGRREDRRSSTSVPSYPSTITNLFPQNFVLPAGPSMLSVPPSPAIVSPSKVRSSTSSIHGAPPVAAPIMTTSAAPGTQAVNLSSSPTIAFLMKQRKQQGSSTKEFVPTLQQPSMGPSNQALFASLAMSSSLSSTSSDSSQLRTPETNGTTASSAPVTPGSSGGGSAPLITASTSIGRTDTEIIDEALATSVRDSQSEDQMVQILLDQAVAVRHESAKASTQLLDLVESLLLQQRMNNNKQQIKPMVAPLASQFSLLPANRIAPIVSIAETPRSNHLVEKNDAAQTLAALGINLFTKG